GVAYAGLMLAVYNAVTTVMSLFMTPVIKMFGRKLTYSACLLCGTVGTGLLMFVPGDFATAKAMLWISSMLMGVLWSGMLTVPYSLLADIILASEQADQLGLYVGLFNICITTPQIVASLTYGLIVSNVFDNNTQYAVSSASVFYCLAALMVGPVVVDPISNRRGGDVYDGQILDVQC
ncbi:hypothetical protein KIPB_013355, partial [Kipferlia bialata]